VKNCGAPFHELVATKDMQTSLIAASRSPVAAVKDKALELIISFSEAFKNNRKLSIFQETYQLLHQSGVQFPARDMTALAPVITPQRRTTAEHHNNNNNTNNNNAAQTAHQSSTSPSSFYHPLCSLTPQFLQKLRNEFEIVCNYLEMSIEMFGAASIADLKNHRHSIKVLAEIRNRLAQIMAEIDDDSIIDIALQLNENIRSVQEYFKAKAASHNPALPKLSSVSLKILDVKIHGKDDEKTNDHTTNPSTQSITQLPASSVPPSASVSIDHHPTQKSSPLMDLSIFEQSSSSSSTPSEASSHQSAYDPFAAIATRSEQQKQVEDDDTTNTPASNQPESNSSSSSDASPIDLLSLSILDTPATASSSHSSSVAVDPLAALFGPPLTTPQSIIDENQAELEDLLNLNAPPAR